jgi:hypothetical protein
MMHNNIHERVGGKGMKVQRLFTLMLVFFVLSTATVVASSLWGEYEGYSKAKVNVNGEAQYFSSSDAPAFMIKGTTVLPLRALASSLQALVQWDSSNQTVSLFKPNVHMILVRDIGKDNSMEQPFGVVKQGKRIDFVVFTQVDNLKAKLSSVQVSIITPSGQSAVTSVEKSIVEQKQTFWWPVAFKNVSFDESGIYTVKFSMMLDGDSSYTVVAEKQISSE